MQLKRRDARRGQETRGRSPTQLLEVDFVLYIGIWIYIKIMYIYIGPEYIYEVIDGLAVKAAPSM